MNTSDIVTRLTGQGMQNSYLMTYLGSVRKAFAQSGIELTQELMAKFGQLHNMENNPDALDAGDEEVRAIANKLEDPEFKAILKTIYKAEMIEVLKLLEIELTPEVITAFKIAVQEQPPNFSRLFADVL